MTEGKHSYRTPMGLPVRYTLESDTHIENEFLFGLYEEIFTGKTLQAVGDYFGIAASKGFPNHVVEKIFEIKPHYTKYSHDQATAYFCYAFVIGYPVEKIPYPQFHPRDFLFYGLLRKKWYSFLMLPFFYFICFLSLFIGYRWKDGKFQPKLSGELLWVLRYETMVVDSDLAFFAGPIRFIIKKGAKLRFGSVKKMVFAYFYDDIEHPILKNWEFKL